MAQIENTSNNRDSGTLQEKRMVELNVLVDGTASARLTVKTVADPIIVGIHGEQRKYQAAPDPHALREISISGFGFCCFLALAGTE